MDFHPQRQTYKHFVSRSNFSKACHTSTHPDNNYVSRSNLSKACHTTHPDNNYVSRSNFSKACHTSTHPDNNYVSRSNFSKVFHTSTHPDNNYVSRSNSSKACHTSTHPDNNYVSRKEIFFLKLCLINILYRDSQVLNIYDIQLFLPRTKEDERSCRPYRQPAVYARTCVVNSSFLRQPSSSPRLHRAAKFLPFFACVTCRVALARRATHQLTLTITMQPGQLPSIELASVKLIKLHKNTTQTGQHTAPFNLPEIQALKSSSQIARMVWWRTIHLCWPRPQTPIGRWGGGGGGGGATAVGYSRLRLWEGHFHGLLQWATSMGYCSGPLPWATAVGYSTLRLWVSLLLEPDEESGVLCSLSFLSVLLCLLLILLINNFLIPGLHLYVFQRHFSCLLYHKHSVEVCFTPMVNESTNQPTH